MSRQGGGTSRRGDRRRVSAPARPRESASPASTREALGLRGPSRRQLSRHQRELRRRRAIIVGGAAVLAIMIGVLGFGYWRENIARAQETVAVVFGQRITADDLLREARPTVMSVDRRIALFRANGLTQQATQLQFQRQRLPETTLDNMVEDLVVRREAGRQGISVTSAEIDAKIRQRIAEADAATQPVPTATPGPAAPAEATPTAAPTARPTATPVPTLTDDRFDPALKDYLNQTGYTESQLRRAVETELYEDKLRKQIGEEVAAVQEQVHARHIVFESEEEANAALQQLQGGASFEGLAASQSQDRTTKDKGGDLGWLPRLGRDPAFDEAVFALQPGVLSGVVQTGNGWEIIQVLERDPARTVEERQLDEMRRRHYGDWLAQAMGSPEIERQLTSDKTEWVLQRAAPKRS